MAGNGRYIHISYVSICGVSIDSKKHPNNVVAKSKVNNGGENENKKEGSRLCLFRLLLVVPVPLAGEVPAHSPAHPLPQLAELHVAQLQAQGVHARVNQLFALGPQRLHLVFITAGGRGGALRAQGRVVSQAGNCSG